MKNINDIKEVYFIGIGGIGMSALARYFITKGIKVSGYDRTETTLTRQLTAEGIAVHYEDDEKYLSKEADIVVYTPAIPKNHKELSWYRRNNYALVKRSEVLGEITGNSFNICISGTHGKTTITTLTAHILRHSGYGCNAFLGGIAANYNSNFWSNKKNVYVVEADEYDRSFLKLHPDIAVISAMDADHLDIYGTKDEVELSFIQFSRQIKEGGALLSKWGLIRSPDLKADRHLYYSLDNPKADAYAFNITNQLGGYTFDVQFKNAILKSVRLNMGGLHNIENAVAAMSVAKLLDIEDEKIKAALADFKGVRRRFEYIVAPSPDKAIVYVDDYAHHPAELQAVISGAKLLFADKKCTVIFQPHLFSRTRDFAEAFATSLDLADEVVLLPVYPARELPLPGITSEIIFNNMKNNNKYLLDKKETLQWIKERLEKKEMELLITAGAGNIDQMVLPIKKILNNENSVIE